MGNYRKNIRRAQVRVSHENHKLRSKGNCKLSQYVPLLNNYVLIEQEGEKLEIEISDKHDSIAENFQKIKETR